MVELEKFGFLSFLSFLSCWIASVVVLLSAVAAIKVMILGGWVF